MAAGDGLVGTVGIHFVSGATIEPGVGPAQPEALRRDDAHVVRRVALAKDAAVEAVDVLVLHALHALVALVVGAAGFLERLWTFDYQTLQRTSPPTPCMRASWPVRIPRDVERIAVP